MLSGLKTGKNIAVHFSSWIRFRSVFLEGVSQSVELAGDRNSLLMDFVKVESVMFTSLVNKINLILMV